MNLRIIELMAVSVLPFIGLIDEPIVYTEEIEIQDTIADEVICGAMDKSVLPLIEVEMAHLFSE